MWHGAHLLTITPAGATGFTITAGSAIAGTFGLEAIKNANIDWSRVDAWRGYNLEHMKFGVGEDLNGPNNLIASNGNFFQGGEKGMGEVAFEINKGGYSTFMEYIMNPSYGPNFFLNSIDQHETANSNSIFTPGPIGFGLRTAAWGHQYFGNNDELRHIIGAFLTSERYGPWIAEKITSANEYYGFFRFDIPDLGNRINGNSPWAFQRQDFLNNHIGILSWRIWNAYYRNK